MCFYILSIKIAVREECIIIIIILEGFFLKITSITVLTECTLVLNTYSLLRVALICHLLGHLRVSGVCSSISVED